MSGVIRVDDMVDMLRTVYDAVNLPEAANDYEAIRERRELLDERARALALMLEWLLDPSWHHTPEQFYFQLQRLRALIAARPVQYERMGGRR
jgi:hypothetical protein